MKRSRHQIVYDEGTAENLVLAAAKNGASDSAILRLLRERGMRELSKTQIATRLAKAKLWEQQNKGYRVRYRNGESPEFQQMLNDRLTITQAEIARSLPQKITHPTPKLAAYVKEHSYHPSPKSFRKAMRKQAARKELEMRAREI